MTAGAHMLLAERDAALREHIPLEEDQAILERDGELTVVRVVSTGRYFTIVDHCGVRMRFEKLCQDRKPNGYALKRVGRANGSEA